MTPLSTCSDNVGKKVLVTTDNWFFAPNGRQFRACFGTLHGVSNALDTLGIKVNARSHDWYATVGNMVIAGCQIHYVIQTDNVNTSEAIEDWASSPEIGCKNFTRPNNIYFADEVYK
jgi:hypothetical protein